MRIISAAEEGISVSATARRAFAVLSVAASMLLLLAASSQAVPPAGNWTLVLNEEFSASGLNSTLWTPGWQSASGISTLSNRCVTPTNVSQPGDGFLHIKLTKNGTSNSCEGVPSFITGGLIESNPADGQPGHAGFHYGYDYVEWSVTLPGGKAPAGETACPKPGTETCIANWPALWSLPSSHSDEVDILEGLPNAPYVGTGCFHFLPPWPGESGMHGECETQPYVGVHTFAANWEPTGITFYYDGHEVGFEQSAGNNPEPQYLVANMIAPYGAHPDKPGPGESPLEVGAKHEMLINYVRVWQRSTENNTGSWAARESSTGNTDVYYPHGGQIHRWAWTGSTGWVNSLLGGSVAAGTVPSVARDEGTGNTSVYYVDSEHRIHQWGWTAATGWVDSLIGGSVAAGSSPAAVRAANGNTNVYFVGSDGHIDSFSWTPLTGWALNVIGGSAEMGTTPTAARDPNTGNTSVFYVSSEGQVDNWQWTASTGWANSTLGGSVAPGSSPAVVRDPNNGNANVYYVGSDSQIHNWAWTPSTGWVNAAIGGSAAAGTTPSVTRDRNTGNTSVYYVGTDQKVYDWGWTAATGWVNSVLGGSVLGATSPAAVRAENGNTNVFYVGSDELVHEWTWTPATGWVNSAL